MPEVMVRKYLRKTLSQSRRLILGPPEQSVMTQLIRRDRRSDAFMSAIDYVNYEAVPGDVLEFGVFTGISLALLAKGHSFDDKGMTRRFVGFDSFRGLPPDTEQHARWQAGDCATNHGWHPLLPMGAPVTPQVVFDLFAACELPAPLIEAGWYDETIAATIPAKYDKVALLHIDCDLYESTKLTLDGVAPILQDGCLVLFDDWFHYKGNPNKGEARAFHEFLVEHPEWGAQPYKSYGVFCNSFILYRK
ncbi:MAG: hypothetical protein JNK38_25640 [Acidobacteria bacterium]|nr:hypothetical protein [Acidobacteriota bacterium]